TLDFNNILTSQSLVLMGISASTGVFAGAIQQVKKAAALQRLAELAAEEGTKGDGPIGGLASKARELEAIRALSKMGKLGKRSFLADLLNDRDGPTVYRLQLLLWTLTLAL